MKGKASRLIHGNPLIQNPHGALKTPVFVTGAFDFPDSQVMEDAFQARSSDHLYSRITNPTVSELQDRLKDLAGAEKALCLSSGMAAVSSVFTALLSSGDRVLTAPWLFGNTLSYLKNTLKPYGVDTDFCDLKDLEAVEKAIRPETRILLVETLSNPQLYLHDMQALGDICERRGVALVVDNSLLTPYLFQSRKFKVDVEILSTTKFLSGGGTGIGGAILFFNSNKWKGFPKLQVSLEVAGPMALYHKIFFEVYRNLGACMAPQTAFQQLLGLETLVLRVERAQKNALETARFLQTLPAVKKVIFPGLEDFPHRSLVEPVLQGNTGQMILLEMESKEASYRFMDRLKMIRRATNFCDNKSLIIHPASTIFSSATDQDLQEMGFSRASLRLSVGIEDIEDILEDLEQAAVES